MNAYPNILLFFFQNFSLIMGTFSLWKQAKQDELHTVLSHLLPWTLCQSWNFPFAVRHIVNLLVPSFVYRCSLFSSCCTPSFSPACVSSAFVEITSSKPFPCFAVPFLHSCHAMNRFGLCRSQLRAIFFPRSLSTSPLFSVFPERRHRKNIVWMKRTRDASPKRTVCMRPLKRYFYQI